MSTAEKIIETNRLILRKWRESDAEDLFEYAKDPDVGPAAGWPPHKSVEDSLNIIRKVFLPAREAFCICEKGSGRAIGAVELIINSKVARSETECELGYWLAKPFWGLGYMPEAAHALMHYGFDELKMTGIWCAYYSGNEKSKRVQEKLGFIYHHTEKDVKLSLINEVRDDIVNFISKEQFENMD